MPSDNSRFRLLVQTAPGPAAVRRSLNGQRFNFTMTPLQAAQRRGVARAVGWHVLTPSQSSHAGEYLEVVDVDPASGSCYAPSI
ncbi:MAG TPA: hypothetical protein VJ251_12490 [Stellaceae bacterium]|nr:hypothetical protein [Stellaceae bacterium]